MVQGGIQLLVSLLNSGAAHLEAALWALQSVIALHPANQAAAVQTGALSKLVGLLETGPDTAVAEYAADCLCFLAQVTSTLFHHLSTLQVMYHCSSYSTSKFLSCNSWWWLAAASAEHSLRSVCSCSVPDWQLVSIVEINRMSMLQHMLLKILSFRVHPAIRTHVHYLQMCLFIRHAMLMHRDPCRIRTLFAQQELWCLCWTSLQLDLTSWQPNQLLLPSRLWQATTQQIKMLSGCFTQT